MSCSPVLHTPQGTCRRTRSAGPHTESGVLSTGCSDTRPPPLCSYHLLIPPGRCSGILWFQGCWSSFHMEQRSRRHRVHHSFCPCIGPRLWHRYRHSRPRCPHRKLHSGRVQTNICLMWLCRGFLKNKCTVRTHVKNFFVCSCILSSSQRKDQRGQWSLRAIRCFTQQNMVIFTASQQEPTVCAVHLQHVIKLNNEQHVI